MSNNDIEKLNDRIAKIESLLAPLGLLNIFDDYSSMGNSFWLEGYLKDVEKQSETVGIANGDYLDAIRKEKAEYVASSERNKKFEPTEGTLNKMMASSAGIVMREYIRNEIDEIRMIFFDVLNKKITIAEARRKAENKVTDRPEGFGSVERSPEQYDMLSKKSSLFEKIVEYNDRRLKEEMREWSELKTS